MSSLNGTETPYQWFDFTSLISERENDRYCSVLEQSIDAGEYDPHPDHHPKFQTVSTRFFDTNTELLNLKMSFIYACFAYAGRPLQMIDLKSWGVMTKPDIFKTINGGWHHHDQYQEYGCNSVLSGIYYARVNNQNEGTLFKDFVLEPRIRNWAIFPGTLEHTTNKVEGPDWRMLFVADLLYK